MSEVDTNTRKPPEGYSNSQWQQDFLKLRASVQPLPFLYKERFHDSCRNLRTYHGKTQYHYYCDFINSILKTIRKGGIDYCYYIYQVADLLKYEHGRLEAEWLEEDSCFKLSLISHLRGNSLND